MAVRSVISHGCARDRFDRMHRITDPAILYFGTPVVLVSTLNSDGTPNLAPMSSAWWLGHHAMLGLAGTSMTTQNLLRERECVLNLPDVAMVEHVDRIAKTTGSSPVPEGKLKRGYRHVADKFGLAELSAIPSDLVRAPRVAECPIQLEATLVEAHPFGGFAQALEVRVEHVHAEEDVLAAPNRIDPDEWRPLIMSFQRFYGLTSEQAGSSRLAEIPEESYRRNARQPAGATRSQ
jgi:flavin reductase (DIM6/NTAB) family NADH-FMN oxidoreductase RutF